MVITFLDGRQEAYPFTHQETKDGELHLWVEYPGGVIYQRYDERWVPLTSILIRKAEDDR